MQRQSPGISVRWSRNGKECNTVIHSLFNTCFRGFQIVLSPFPKKTCPRSYGAGGSQKLKAGYIHFLSGATACLVVNCQDKTGLPAYSLLPTYNSDRLAISLLLLRRPHSPFTHSLPISSPTKKPRYKTVIYHSPRNSGIVHYR